MAEPKEAVLPASLVLANHFGEGWRSRYGIKYFCQNRFWSGFLAAWIWPAWIKHEDDMGNAACSLWDSRDCPPRRHLAPLTVLITMTLAFMKDSTHFRKSARLPASPPPPSRQGFLPAPPRDFFFFIKPWIAPFCVPTCVKCNQREDNATQSTFKQIQWIENNLSEKQVGGYSSFVSASYLPPLPRSLFPSPVCVYAVWLWTRIAGYSLFSCCASFFSVPRLRACWQPWLERLSSFLPFCSKILCEPQIFEGVSYLRRLFTSIFHAWHQLCFLQSLMRKKVGCSATRLHQSVSLTIKPSSNIRAMTCASWRAVLTDEKTGSW